MRLAEYTFNYKGWDFLRLCPIEFWTYLDFLLTGLLGYTVMYTTLPCTYPFHVFIISMYLIFSSDYPLQCTFVMYHPCNVSTLAMYPCHAPMSYTLVIHPCRVPLPCVLVVHPCHTPSPCTPAMDMSHYHFHLQYILPCTLAMHPYYIFLICTLAMYPWHIYLQFTLGVYLWHVCLSYIHGIYPYLPYTLAIHPFGKSSDDNVWDVAYSCRAW